MFTSAELILALQRRLRRSIRPQPPLGQLPEGWQSWLDTMKARADRVTGAGVEAIIAIFAGRQPVFPTGYQRLNAAQAFVSLLRHERHRDERGVRIASMALTLLFHVFWFVSMIWLMYARFTGPMPVDERFGEDTAVQVEFIGDGTPDEEAGGAPAAIAEQSDASDARPQQAQSSSAAATPPLPEPAQAPTQPETQPVDTPAQQPLQVTETSEPDTDFVVPPIQAEGIRAPVVSIRQPTVPQIQIRSIDAPPVPPSLRPLPQREVAVPETPTPRLEARIRELPMQPDRVELREVATPGIEAPVIRSEARAVTARDIPMPSPPAPTASGAGTGQSPSASDRQASGTTATSPAPGSGQGVRPDAAATGSGAAPVPGAGALPTARRGDDWGASTRDRPGGTSGLFNPDGSPRMAGSAGRVGGGLPPGTVTEDYEKIDRMGTWLKRPPTDYEPTSFDRFWVPQESLLQEWVRRSIKEVLIPIPGTSKSIRCAVAILALGGACGLFDPNMVDVEAEARPPPDIPFKPDLHEDQDSLSRPPPGG
ncbi:MAG: hypothetical protein NVV60_00100 [Luteimonas sp.]|nr:hypothetical protein [Luteimonas sp.]